MHKNNLKIYIFYCAASPAIAESVQSCAEKRGEIMKPIALPCAGKIDIPYLTKAFETGADGAAVVICKQGECLFLEGGMRARKRAEAVEALLEETGLGKGRIAVIQMVDGDRGQITREIEDFCGKIEALPAWKPVKPGEQA